MIPQIEEYFGDAASYATLSNATVSLAEMGDRLISTQVKIDGDVVPNFDGWELRFRGERFVLNVKDPQAAKDNSSINSIIDLTFYSWVTEQLKRYFMFSVPATATGVITVDKYDAPVSLDIQNFGTLLNQVLTYYFHGKITCSVNSGTTSDVASIELNYTKIWDVMQKIFEMYGVRWRIEYNSSQDTYVIKIGYPAPEIDDHEFEYGFQGGLMRFERQVQSSDITNILLGRGGEKNVPYRYFKKTDPQNPEWAADPDAIPELANVYMDRIRDINFRWYIRGWVKNEHRDTSHDDGYTLPDYDEADVPHEYLWAYQKGRYTDETFDPVEYVKDDASILKYGEHWGHLDDDDDIYPTIQGIEVAGARADLVVAVSEITTDDIQATTEASANIVDLSNGVVSQTNDIEGGRTGEDLQYEEIYGDKFTVPSGMIANLAFNDFFITADAQRATLARLAIVTEQSRVVAVRESDGAEISPSGLTAGDYRYIIYVAIRNVNEFAVKNATYGVNGLRLEQSSAGSGDEWKPTFDIWIRNIFETGKLASETPEEYALRVWVPILGDHLGSEAAVAFSDGQMSISEDYTFKIAEYPKWDQSKTLNGQQSEWKLTLYKTDAEFEATGLYVPNATTGGRPIAGDHFYFLGIDMPHFYVENAEMRVNENKALSLYQTSDISPTWVVSLDHVRMDQEYNESQERLFDKIEAGVKMFVYDKRFSGGNTLALFANSVTFTWADDTVILPRVEVVLTDKIAVTKSQIAQMRGDISNLKSSIAQMSGVENLVRESIKPLFLAKTGEEQTSLSPTKFTSLLTSEDFKQGGFGGSGWGFYRDNSMSYQNLEQVANVETRGRRMLMAAAAPTRAAEPDSDAQEAEAEEAVVPATPSIRAGSQSVLEVDRLIVRRDMQVNNLVVNQIAYVGGKQIISAAAMECVQVVDGDGYYDCYFDQKQGSVKNLFQVNDIAMGQVFTAENLQLRFYKCVVTKVGLDYIRLSKTQKYGSGVPAKGDVIVQFGNTVNKDRQYAIVRDVIGGGYEQMLSDLDSIYNNGVEYYFAGLKNEVTGDFIDLADSQDNLLATKQPEDKVLGVLESAKPRFFVGTADSHIDYTTKDGILRLKGNIVQSPSGVEFPIACWRGDYDPDEWYYYGDLVIYNGSNWIHIGKDRTKGTTPATGNVWRLYTESRPIIYGDLDNEMDAIGVGDDGILDVPVPYSNALSTTMRIYYGTQVLQLTGLNVSGVPNGISYERVQSGGVYTGQIKFWAPSAPVNLSAGRYAITITATANVNNQNVQYECVYTLMGSRQGKDGATFILVPNINAVKKTYDGTLSDRYITCDATDSTGATLDTYYIYYSMDGAAQALYKQRVNGGGTQYGPGLSDGIPTVNINTSVKLYLYIDSADISRGQYVDTETIPLIIDGANGDNGVAIFRWTQNGTTGPAVPESLAYPPAAATNWYSSAQNRPADGWYLWMSTGNLNKLTNQVDAWASPVRISGDDGTPGEDGDEREWIYAYTNTPAPSTINTGTIPDPEHPGQRISSNDKNQADWVPTGWTDNPQGVSNEHKTEYAAYRDVIHDGQEVSYGTFQTPIIWSHFGERGIDGDGIEYAFVRTKGSTPPVVFDDGTYVDSYGNDYTKDEHLPKVRTTYGSDIMGNTHFDVNGYKSVTIGGIPYYVAECTDEPQGVDNTWRYEWVVVRSKQTPDADGRRDWNPYDGTMTLWTNYAQKGDKGNPGKLMRGPNAFSSSGVAGGHYQGLNDEYDANHTYYDVVYTAGSNVNEKIFWYCQNEKNNGTWAENITPGNETGTRVEDRCWIQASQYEFVATRVFLAENAEISILGGNKIYVRDSGGDVSAGMIGGSGVNFFAGADQSHASEAPFMVDNSGNLVAKKATIKGKIITGTDPADPNHYQGSSLVSLGGLFVSDGGASIANGNLGVASGNLIVTNNDDNALHLIQASNGTKQAEVSISGVTGSVTLTAKNDSNNLVVLNLLGSINDATIARGGESSESIVSSPWIKHIVVCANEAAYNAISPKDEFTLYVVKS